MQEAEDQVAGGERTSVRRTRSPARPIVLVGAWHPFTHCWVERGPTVAPRIWAAQNGHTAPHATVGEMAGGRTVDPQTTIARSIRGGPGVQVTAR